MYEVNLDIINVATVSKNVLYVSLIIYIDSKSSFYH